MTRSGIGGLLGLCLAVGLVPGCAQRSLCDSTPGTCSVKLQSGLTGSVTDQGATIIVQLDYQQMPPDPTQIEVPSKILLDSGIKAAVTLTQNTTQVQKPDETLTRNDEKSVSITLTAADVKTLTAGPLTVAVTIGSLGMVQGMFSLSKRLPFGPAISAATVNNPVWVGIHRANAGRSGDVVTTEQFTDPVLMQPQRKVSAYTFSGGMIRTPPRDITPALAPPLYTGIALDSAIVYEVGQPPVLQSWSLTSTMVQSLGLGKVNGAKQISALAAGPGLVAALTDIGLKAFADPGTFMAQVNVGDAGHANPAAAALLGAGDVDGDTQPDLVVITQATPQVTLVFLAKSGQLTYDPNYSQVLGTTLGTATTISQLAVGNLDHTNGGLADLAVVSGSTVRLIQNLGTGNFASVAVNTLTAAAAVDCVAIGDVDGDTKNDLALCNSTGKSISVMLNQSP